jgi:phosphoinositide-3-kinase regulatory subunit 4
MGASQSGLALLNRPSGTVPETYVGELGIGVQYERSLGSSRFLKSIRARAKNGRLVVKVFVKQDPSLSLKSFVRRLKREYCSLISRQHLA